MILGICTICNDHIDCTICKMLISIDLDLADQGY